jgi:hypothetical protein
MSRFVDLDQVEFLKVDGNKEFNHGVDCCINRLLKAEPIKAVSLDKVKQAREEIRKKTYEYSGSGDETIQAYCDGFKDSL